jgi:chaperonin GroES
MRKQITITNLTKSKSMIRPLADRVLVLPDPAETKTASGIIIPDTAKEKPDSGTVIAVGGKVTDITQGDKVLYRKYAGTEVSNEGKTYLVMKADDVIAIIEN